MSGALLLEGKVAFVAGAAGRFGRTMAVALAEAGAEIVLASATRETAEEFAINSIANELWALERRYLTLTMDYDEPESVVAAFGQALRELGRLDLLVNAAGPPPNVELPFASMPEAEWERVLRLRLGGVALTCRAAGQAMLERDGGSILNLVTPAGEGKAGEAALAAAEAGILGLTRSLALEWQGRVRVNAAILRVDTPPESLGLLVTLLGGAGPSGLSGQVFEL